ncbi:MAG: rRNA maturation RNase YbeY [Anaerolineae bacterium]
MANEGAIDVQVREGLGWTIPTEEIIQAVQATLLAEGAPEAEVTVVLTDDEEIQALNRTYAGVDAPTDVLSFSALEGDDSFVRPLEEQPYLGDIIISVPYAARQADEQGHALLAELLLLTVHGTLHLLGYDHATEEEEAEMWARQAAILAQLRSSREGASP